MFEKNKACYLFTPRQLENLLFSLEMSLISEAKMRGHGNKNKTTEATSSSLKLPL